jgi:hypothetical protein
MKLDITLTSTNTEIDPACLNYEIDDLTAEPIKMYDCELITGLKFDANLIEWFQACMHDGIPTVRVKTNCDCCTYILRMLENGIRGVEHIKHLLR